MDAVQFALDNLANHMRIYAENSLRFKELAAVDAEEAINNLDRAFESKLEAFHRVYDITKSEFGYFEYADTSLLILLRNAIHHRDHPLFRSWNSEMHLNGGMNRHSGTEFIFAGYKVAESGKTSEYYFRFSDILDRIDESRGSAYIEKKMSTANRAKLLELVKTQLKADEIKNHAEAKRYPINQVYLNVMHIYISGASRMFQHFKDTGFTLRGYDSAVYAEHFTASQIVDLDRIEYNTLRIEN